MKIGEKEKKKTGERSIDVYNRSKTKARPAGTIGQWYAIWFPLGTVMADRGYLGCSYSWCIINVGLTWPSRSTRIRRIAAKRPTADGPYKDPFYLCMCTGSLFQDKRWPGTRSPFCLWSSKPWTIPLSLSLSLFLSVPEENYCAPTGVQSSYPRISVPLLCFPDFIGEETARVLFHPRSTVPVSRNAWFTLIGLFPEGSRCFHLIYRSPTRTSFSISLRIIASLPDSRHSKNESW